MAAPFINHARQHGQWRMKLTRFLGSFFAALVHALSEKTVPCHLQAASTSFVELPAFGIRAQRCIGP